ncbi:PQQ-binding-like beta-propeller repeat protein [Streptomyces sp. PanSC9]|uniref:PQQ-binding-like beta-propeller repeat protein n=1 Tax=Streptomyces sp. PanSC9 TaxID=1520461 RepID=UPI000F90D61A|nr:PQQ-binding-like beta-propeller repeat protein [Streptomyces sp. PanSC9]ROP44166.1 putative pyrroloquinoline-quinone binding quinoprotein [Streptomyces sp. PanSC9]
MASAITLTGLTGCSSHPDLSDHIPQSPVWQKKAKADAVCLDYRQGTISYVSENKISLLDARTGATNWVSGDLGTTYSCPLYTHSAVYYGIGTNTVAALSPTTGKPLWKKKYDDFQDEAAIRPTVSDTGIHFLINDSIISINTKSHKETWRRTEREDMWVENMTATGNTVIVTTPNGKVRAISAADGTVKWTYTTPTHARIKESPVTADNTLYFGAYDAYAYALSADTGKLKWRTKLQGVTGWSPLIVDHTMFIPDAYYFNGINTEDGHVKWTKDYDNYDKIASDGQHLVYADKKAGRFYGIDPDNGDKTWQLSIKEKMMLWCLSKNMLYITTPTHLSAYKLP